MNDTNERKSPVLDGLHGIVTLGGWPPEAIYTPLCTCQAAPSSQALAAWSMMDSLNALLDQLPAATLVGADALQAAGLAKFPDGALVGARHLALALGQLRNTHLGLLAEHAQDGCSGFLPRFLPRLASFRALPPALAARK